jgi:rRNA maturation endonuclease Nob1
MNRLSQVSRGSQQELTAPVDLKEPFTQRSRSGTINSLIQPKNPEIRRDTMKSMEARISQKIEKSNLQKVEEVKEEMSKQKKDFEKLSKKDLKRYNNSLKHYQEKFEQSL